MSKVGTVKSEGIKAYFRILFGFDNQTTISNLDDTVEDIKPSEDISESDIEELKKSTKRIQSLEEKYKIEKFEISQKAYPKEKSGVAKKVSSKKEKEVEPQEKQELEKSGEERER